MTQTTIIEIQGKDSFSGVSAQAEDSVRRLGSAVSNFPAATKSATAAADSMGKQFKDLGRELGLAFGLGVVVNQLKSFAIASVAAARESAAAEAQLEAVLRSTGGAAGMTKDQLTAMATELQKVTMFSDEAVIGGQSLLLTFTNIGSTVFPQATQTILDMSQALGQDLKSSAIQLGKALNDPVAGISALSRVGVTFSETQKQQIQTMVAMNDVTGAQQVILAELNKEFGGSAEAARLAAGGFKDVEVSFGDFQESVGGLMTVLGDSGLTGVLVDLFDQMAAGAESWGNIIKTTEAMTDQAKAASEAAGATDTLGMRMIGVTQATLKAEHAATTEAAALQTAAAAAEAELAALGPLNSSLIASGNLALAASAGQQALARGMAAAAAAANTQQQALDAATARYQGLANAQRTMAGGRDILETMAGGSTFTADEATAYKKQQEEKEQAANDFSKAMASSFEQAADSIRSTIESVIKPSLDEVWKPPEGAEIHIDEAARRMATVATSGFGSEWLTTLSGQFAGQDFFQPITQAMQSGDETALKEAATNILTNSVTKLWDPEVIKAKVKQQIQEANLREDLITQIQEELSAEGVEVPLESVAAAAGDVSSVAPDVSTGIGEIGQSATDAAMPLTDLNTTLSTVQSSMATFVDDLGTKLSDAATKIIGFKSAITDAKWSDVGKDIVTGISKGIQDNLDKVRTTLKNLAMEAITAAKTELGIASPSKPFAEMGREIVAGLVNSVIGGIPDFQGALDKLLNLKHVGTGFMDAFGQARDDIEKSMDEWLNPDKVEFALRAMSKMIKNHLAFAQTATDTQLEDLLMHAVSSWAGVGIDDPEKMVGDFVNIFRDTQARLKQEAQAAVAENFKKMIGGVGQFASAASQEADALAQKISVLNTLLRQGGESFNVEGQIMNAAQAQNRLNQLIAEQTGLQSDLAGITGFQAGLQNMQEVQGLLGGLAAPVDQAAGDIVGGLNQLTGFLGQQIMAMLGRQMGIPIGGGTTSGTGGGAGMVGGNQTNISFSPQITTVANEQSILQLFYQMMSMIPGGT